MELEEALSFIDFIFKERAEEYVYDRWVLYDAVASGVVTALGVMFSEPDAKPDVFSFDRFKEQLRTQSQPRRAQTSEEILDEVASAFRGASGSWGV